MTTTLEQEHSLFFHTYQRLPLEVERGEGCYLYTKDGSKYLDMFSGLAVNALGYAHPAVTAAIETQVRKYTHLSNLFLQEQQIKLAALLVKHSGYEKVFLCNSGTEANEGAIKLVRRWGSKKGKSTIFGMSNGFSGRTMGALSLMDKEKYREGYGPFLENFGVIEYNNCADLEARVNTDTAAVFFESIQGEGGIVPMTAEFAAALVALQKKYGFLLVADEIQSGIGRTGRMFAFEQFGMKPDLVTFAKPVGGGLPLGGILGSNAIADVWSPGMHGTTFGGNPVACAAGVAVLGIVLEGEFLQTLRENSAYFFDCLNELKRSCSLIKEVRGSGYMIGVDLTVESGPVVEKLLERRVLVNSTAHTVVRILPPLIAGKPEIDAFIRVFKEVLA
ncbi:MAG TPA: acetylornithine/succinylornithine family transaminase [Bacteroidota bacterium]|nr:acetylornithine/succinylornithine family transaminase [Bacteroidota bacterium]